MTKEEILALVSEDKRAEVAKFFEANDKQLNLLESGKKELAQKRDELKEKYNQLSEMVGLGKDESLEDFGKRSKEQKQKEEQAMSNTLEEKQKQVLIGKDSEIKSLIQQCKKFSEQLKLKEVNFQNAMSLFQKKQLVKEALIKHSGIISSNENAKAYLESELLKDLKIDEDGVNYYPNKDGAKVYVDSKPYGLENKISELYAKETKQNQGFFFDIPHNKSQDVKIKGDATEVEDLEASFVS